MIPSDVNPVIATPRHRTQNGGDDHSLAEEASSAPPLVGKGASTRRLKHSCVRWREVSINHKLMRVMRRLCNVGAFLHASAHEVPNDGSALRSRSNSRPWPDETHHKQFDGVAVVWVVISRYFRMPPLGRCLGRLPELHGSDARRQIREPYVVPISRRELGSWNTPRRTTNRTNANALARGSFTSQSNNSNDHGSLPPYL